MEQSIKQSSDNTRQTNILPELQPGVTCAPKASRKLTETSSFPGPEDREHSVCNHLQNQQNQAAHQHTLPEMQEQMSASSGAWRCQQEAFLSHPPALPLLGLVSHWELRAAWFSASLMQESCNCSPASLLVLLPWSLAGVLTAYQTAQWLPGWAQEISCSGDLPSLTTEQLILKSDYSSWKQWGKHHQYFNYCASAASHGITTNKHSLLLTYS